MVTTILGVCNCSMFCTLLYVHSSFAIIIMGKSELVALLSLSSWCLVIFVWLFLTVPWVCLLFMIVVILGHTHYFCLYLFFIKPQLHCHDFGHDGATTHPDLSSRDASA